MCNVVGTTACVMRLRRTPEHRVGGEVVDDSEFIRPVEHEVNPVEKHYVLLNCNDADEGEWDSQPYEREAPDGAVIHVVTIKCAWRPEREESERHEIDDA